MIKIVTKNQLFFIGKVSDLLEVLEDISTKHRTLQSFIDECLESQ